jgi:toxin ParE1/3/4
MRGWSVAIRLVYLPAAKADLENIYDWIADRVDPRTAFDYVLRLQAACERLPSFPRRGTPRGDLAPGLRTIAFERRAIIVYREEGARLRIVRIVHRGRDLGQAFAPD